MRRSTVRYGRSPQVDHDMGTCSPLLGDSRLQYRSTESLAPILFSMGYGCFLPRAGYAAFFDVQDPGKARPPDCKDAERVA
jgi:hypothetical protein